jgi:hypothetical protein
VIREDFIPTEARFLGVSLGDEAADTVSKSSPMGNETISYRTTKVGFGVWRVWGSELPWLEPKPQNPKPLDYELQGVS